MTAIEIHMKSERRYKLLYKVQEDLKLKNSWRLITEYAPEIVKLNTYPKCTCEKCYILDTVLYADKGIKYAN